MNTSTHKKATSIQIGNISLDNPFLLAPLAGITDAPMRRICKKMGASMVYSEMVSGKGLYYRDKNTERLLDIFPDEKPITYQLFGSEDEILYFAAKELAGHDNAVFDINMGCPVPKVVKNGEGSALLKNPDKIYNLISMAVKGASDGAKERGLVPKPVTAKIRMGFDENSINAVEVAKAIEAAGGSAVAIHGRTREQYYNGTANWDIIKQVKEAVRIPVIGNGDIFSGQDAIRMMAHTNCNMVMIARGALGNPWIFKDANTLLGLLDYKVADITEPLLSEASAELKKVSLKEKLELMIKHYNDLVEYKGEYAAVREMRKFIGWYLKGEHGSAAVRRKTNNITTSAQYNELFNELLSAAEM